MTIMDSFVTVGSIYRKIDVRKSSNWARPIHNRGTLISPFVATFPQTLFIFFIVTCSLISQLTYGANDDTLRIGGNITDGQTLVSFGSTFELAFFTAGTSGNRYLGIRYKTGFPAFVWVANREIPLRDTLGVLRFIAPGKLVLTKDTGRIIWNSTEPSRPTRNPVAQILDSGNLVIRDAEGIFWQSFDHPTDTYLPGMNLGLNLVTGSESYLSSWTSDDDTSPGEYSLHVDPTGYPQIVVKSNDSVKFRSVISSVVRPSGPRNSSSRVSLIMNSTEVMLREDYVSGSSLWRSRLNQAGVQQRFAWDNSTQDWFLYKSTPNVGDLCDSYGYCGANSICTTIEGSGLCECVSQFVSADVNSKGCRRRTMLQCGITDVFLNYSGIKLPDTTNSWFNGSSKESNEECREECLRNCSCTAYTEVDGRGRGCLFYSGDLMDMKKLSPDQDSQNLYIRVNASAMENSPVDEYKSKKRKVVLLASLAAGVGGILLLVGFMALIRHFWRKNSFPSTRGEVPNTNSSSRKDSGLPFFNLSEILKATNNFSSEKKLGEGGFGAVYKGMLDDGEEIAVKRLSKTSTQGVEELKNEVILIAKLQHRNLVRLLGCCVEEGENLLIYEYMPNNGLDLILFDQTKSMLLDWRKRFNIINGIAKGLLYLHQDSRLRIIHRDLKASNILLDQNMNPRISDFGLARIVGGNESEVQTHKIVGTFGYMPPEYAVEGVFSVKSDIYSFGVLVLEIVSGKRNKEMVSHGESYVNLIGYAWKLEQEGNSISIIDAALRNSFDSSEVLRLIRVALLCVQKYPEDRPNMSSLIFMLGNEVAVGEAKEPGFYTQRDVLVGSGSSSSKPTTSHNGVTISNSLGR